VGVKGGAVEEVVISVEPGGCIVASESTSRAGCGGIWLGGGLFLIFCILPCPVRSGKRLLERLYDRGPGGFVRAAEGFGGSR
jgi:hypothetical protein